MAHLQGFRRLLLNPRRALRLSLPDPRRAHKRHPPHPRRVHRPPLPQPRRAAIASLPIRTFYACHCQRCTFGTDVHWRADTRRVLLILLRVKMPRPRLRPPASLRFLPLLSNPPLPCLVPPPLRVLGCLPSPMLSPAARTPLLRPKTHNRLRSPTHNPTRNLGRLAPRSQARAVLSARQLAKRSRPTRRKHPSSFLDCLFPSNTHAFVSVYRQIAGTSHAQKGLPLGAIIGIGIGAAVALLLLVALFLCVMRRRRRAATARRRMTAGLPSPTLPLQDPARHGSYFFGGYGTNSNQGPNGGNGMRELYLAQGRQSSFGSGMTMQGRATPYNKDANTLEPIAPAVLRDSVYTNADTATLASEDGYITDASYKTVSSLCIFLSKSCTCTHRYWCELDS